MMPGFEDIAAGVAQFEPDFDGSWDAPDPALPAAETADDLQWIVWLDAARESAWAAAELVFEWRAAVGITKRQP